MGKGEGGGEEKIFFHSTSTPTRPCTNPLPVKHPVTIQDGGIEPIYLQRSVFRYEITPALQAKLNVARNSFQHVHYNHCILVDGKLMASKIYPIIAEYVAVDFHAQ